ncbi:hypothetical protein HU200_049409 [Digitaria exilis]|uniref:No apical meristem-associated C-terminal domain-containing protein n=1 Tax=Digitaria exilis TaxID=1010633 RepID=A0A835E8M3_9POAL|nr:hypothetical protein HU200_049409 [Digitaria exilis]CAB3499447.1 unnamed protein product [Digitaria exilis]
MSRQPRKEAAAAAARDLLKADAARVRKAGVARKDAVAPQRKGLGQGRMPPAPELGSSWAGKRIAGHGAVAATPPRSFSDGNFFFNSNAGNFFGSPGQRPQSWNPQSSDPATWGTNATPPGGFTSLIQPNMSQNFIFGGQAAQFAPFKPPRNMQDEQDAQSEEGMWSPISAKDNNAYVNVDSGEEAHRTEKRIYWTQEEDVRMMSSWLLNSTDSTCGADRKNDQYWTDVEVTYNETTPSNRARNAKQIKDRFHKVNRWTDLFHSAWLKAKMVYTSGYSDQMWIEKAHVLYVEDNKKLKLGPFVLMEVWNTVKTEAKWITYNNGLKAATNRAATKGPGNENEGEDEVDTDLDDLDEKPRRMGQKQAKKLKFAKSKEVEHIDLEELDKFSKIQDNQNANRLKVLEVQQKLSTEKMEQTRLAHLAAKEQKEARKLELESRIFETYNHLLSRDLSLMSDEEKLDHVKTMQCLKKKLFAEN